MDEYFSDRVRNLCNSRNITVKDFEKEMGYANGYISHVSTRHYRPKEMRLKQIADYFGVSPEWLLGEQTEYDKEIDGKEGVKIPLVGRVAAGIPITATQNILDYEEIPAKLAKTGEFFALRIKGDSMSPYIMDGDIVIVKQQNDAETDEIVIALINGDDGVCKKLKKNDNSIALISLNASYEPMIFTNEEIRTKPVTIIGKVVEIRRSI